MVSAELEFASFSLNAICGMAENSTTSAPSILKSRSGMSSSRYNFCLGSEFREEIADLLPHLGTSGQTAPVNANQSHKPVARVNRDNVVLRSGSSACVAHAVNQ